MYTPTRCNYSDGQDTKSKNNSIIPLFDGARIVANTNRIASQTMTILNLVSLSFLRSTVSLFMLNRISRRRSVTMPKSSATVSP